MSTKEAMDEMHRLHSCLVWKKRKRNPERLIEEPTEKQAAILKAFGFKLANGVLQGNEPKCTVFALFCSVKRPLAVKLLSES